MEEPDGAVGVEGWSAADSPEVCSEGTVMTDPGGAGGTRELGGVEGTLVPGGAEGARSQGEADWSMARGGAEGSEGRGGARESPCHGRAGDSKPQGGSWLHGRAEGLKESSGAKEWLALVERAGEEVWMRKLTH